jgi:D-3-phosphoglycerate dehydrogenase / 2-oxoglutarate reductase
MDILITEEVGGAALERLGETYDIVREGVLWKDEIRLKQTIREARTIIVRHQTQLTANLLTAAPNLIGIGRIGVGLDNIDVPAASERGIVIIAPLGANAVSVAELTMGLVIALARQIPSSDFSTKAGEWNRQGFIGVELDGKTLAICGFGRIGRLVATRARAFGLGLLVYDPFIKPDASAVIEAGAVYCERLEDALAQADFVTVHTPLTPETVSLFNSGTFAAMKRGSHFINTARGRIVDEKALQAALESNHLAGAALDVRELEPPLKESPFEKMKNVILTPHIASFTTEAQTRTVEAVAADIDRVLRGEPTVNFVNFSRPR